MRRHIATRHDNVTVLLSMTILRYASSNGVAVAITTHGANFRALEADVNVELGS